MIDLFTLFKSMKYDSNVLCNMFVFFSVFVVWDFEFLYVKISENMSVYRINVVGL